jgi:hypothetical protein
MTGRCFPALTCGQGKCEITLRQPHAVVDCIIRYAYGMSVDILCAPWPTGLAFCAAPVSAVMRHVSDIETLLSAAIEVRSTLCTFPDIADRL